MIENQLNEFEINLFQFSMLLLMILLFDNHLRPILNLLERE
jgi:hypothetical protein